MTVLIAVSGGPDSVALLRGLHRTVTPGAEGRILVAHYHHGLRGETADEDEEFVRDLCQRLGLECRVEHGDVGKSTAGDGVEAAARSARYEFLRRTAEAEGARYVVTGHTADDQAETILHHALRGTSLAGLAGMQQARPLGEWTSLVRPLLSFRRAELLEYLNDLGQTYCMDETNADPQFTRNRIRRDLLPALSEAVGGDAVTALVRLGRLAGEAQKTIEGLAEEFTRQAVAVDSSGVVTVDCGRLQSQTDHLIRETMVAIWRSQNWPRQAMTCEIWDQLAQMVKEPHSGKGLKRMLPGAIVAERSGRELRLSRAMP